METRVSTPPKQKPLTFMDYCTRSAEYLVRHPDFSNHAMRVVSTIMNMTTEQLEEIDITRFNKEEKK